MPHEAEVTSLSLLFILPLGPKLTYQKNYKKGKKNKNKQTKKQKHVGYIYIFLDI